MAMTSAQNSDRAPSRPTGDRRVPPHNLDAEASLLGAMLLSSDVIGLAVERQLKSADFYKPAHQHIFDAIRALLTNAQAVDPVTVADVLRRAKILDELGGLDYLLELQNSTPSIASADRYIRIVRDTAKLRRLILTATEIAEIGYSEPEDIIRAIDNAERMVFDIAEEEVTDSLHQLDTLTKDVIEILEDRFDKKQEFTGLATGFFDIDGLLSGLQPGTLNIIGARPAMGKSAFALAIATNVAKKTRQPVLFFSLEMGATELTQRILSSESGVDSEHLRTGRLTESDWTKLSEAVGRLNVPLYIDDNSLVTVTQIRQKIRRITQRDAPPALVVIDYLQLMGGDDKLESRQLQVSDISRNLKLIAREFNIPVVALSQLSRTLEGRTEKRPQLSDLRESGALEQDADVVMFIYRDELVNPPTEDTRGWAEIIVAKHRAGPIGMRKLLFVPHLTTFANPARSDL